MYLIEKNHLDFLKRILKLKKPPTTPNIMIYGEFGRYPLEIMIEIRMVKYWCKLLIGIKIQKYRAFCTNYCTICITRVYIKSEWIQKIEKIIQEAGLNYIWLNNGVQNLDHFCETIKTKLQCQFVQNWNQGVFNGPKCLNYRLFKTTFILETYITELSLKSASTLARFRTTNHKLPIAKGRRENIERNQRTCNLCNRNALFSRRIPFFARM